jgi:ParB family transcriptional regulator, chromosome partitioning protein
MARKKLQKKPRSKLVDLDDLRYDVGVKNVPTKALKPNPHNPRRLFDPIPMKELRESIEKVGILIPLAVYWSARERTFVILDGQRRWMCAQTLGLETVPVNQLAEPDTVQNIVTMFQIHNTREDWELMPTALKLEVLMNELQEKNEKRLSTLTGLNPAVVSRCKKLLSYERVYQDLMLNPDPTNRLKADFFIELYALLVDRNIKVMDWYSRRKFIDRMLEKYLSKSGIRSVTDFRLVKQYVTSAVHIRKRKTITKRLREFLMNDSVPLEYLNLEGAELAKTVRRTLGSVDKFDELVRDIDVEELYGEEELWDALRRVIESIKQKFREAGRRLA